MHGVLLQSQDGGGTVTAVLPPAVRRDLAAGASNDAPAEPAPAATAECIGRHDVFDLAADGDPAAVDAALDICAACPALAEMSCLG